MKSAISMLALALSLSTLGACYRATFYRDPSVTKGVEHDEWTDFYVFGLVGEESFDVHEFCPTGEAAVVQTGGNFGTGLVSVLTIGIYTPRKVYVTCAQTTPARAARALELSADQAGRPRRASVRLGERELRFEVAAVRDRAFRLSERIE